MNYEEKEAPKCSICGKPADAYTLVHIADGGGRIWLCPDHEREAHRRFTALLRAMAKEGAK